jgi:ABC-2 type transport system ATP-binding protein
MIQVEGLTKDYGARRAIDHLSFNADKGEIVGFLGPNGAGKTTTMRILCGYMPPTSGNASVAGFDVVDQSLEVRRRVGYMPETVPLYPDMTVYDYLKFMANLRHLRDSDERVMDVLEQVHMEDRAEGYIDKLSKGMRQRIGLAQALLHQPEVLILDEPTIGLDPKQIHEVRNLIQELGRERTVMLSTHILSEAQQVCNRVLIINKGKIVVEDTPERLQARVAGSQRVALSVAGDDDGLDTTVSKVPGVTRILMRDNGNLEFETHAGQDVRADVARAVVQSGYDLIELHRVGLSLEDIFLQLTEDEPLVEKISDEGDNAGENLESEESGESREEGKA